MFDIGPPTPVKPPAPLPPKVASKLVPEQPLVKVEPAKDVVRVVLEPPPEPPVPGTFLGPLTVRVDRAMQPVLNLGAPLVFMASTAVGALACLGAGAVAALVGHDPQPFYAAMEFAMPAGTILIPAAMIFIGMRAAVVRQRYRDAGRII